MTPQIAQNEQPQTLGAASFYLPPFKFSQTMEPLQQLEEAYSFLDYYTERRDNEKIARFERDIQVLENILLPHENTENACSMLKEDYEQWHEDDKIPTEIITSYFSMGPLLPDKTGMGFTFSLPRRGYRKEIKVNMPELSVAFTLKNKTSLPLLDGQSSLEETIGFADFDILPLSSFNIKTWDDFELLIAPLVQDRGILLRSASNKVKIMYRLQGRWTADNFKKFLKKELGQFFNLKENELPCLDLCDTALFKCYVSNNMLSSIKKRWPYVYTHILPITVISKHENATLIFDEFHEPVFKPKKRWIPYSGPLPEIFRIGGMVEEGIRWFLGSAKLAVKGIDAPVNYIAGCLNKDTANTSRMLTLFAKKGWISLISDYGERKRKGNKWYTKAKTFVLDGELLVFALNYIKSFITIKTKPSPVLPSALLDGHAHSALFDIAFHFKNNLEAFVAYLRDIPGGSERLDKGLSIFNWVSNQN
jgi:hypothetical protein